MNKVSCLQDPVYSVLAAAAFFFFLTGKLIFSELLGNYPEGDSSPSHNPIEIVQQQIFNSHWSKQLPYNCIKKMPFKTYYREFISLAISEWKSSLERR